MVKSEVIGRLADLVKLRFNPTSSRPAVGDTRSWNHVDAAWATLDDTAWSPQFLPPRSLPRISAVGAPMVGEEVFKVGRTTGPTHGRIVATDTYAGPFQYAPDAYAWFEGVFEVEELNLGLFADNGDSGAIIMKPSGELVGMLFGGNDRVAYAFPIKTALRIMGLKVAMTA